MADNVARGLAMQALGRIPKTTSADAGKLATVDSNGEWTAAELEVGQGEVAVDSTLLVSGAAADSKVTGDKLGELKSAIETKAEVDGYYEQMTVGNAEQLVATVGVEDKAPYNFRTAGGSADIGDRLVEKVVGGTVAWNQFVKKHSEGWDYGYSYSGAISYDGDTVINTAASAQQIDVKTPAQITIVIGHKYFVSYDVKCSEANGIKTYFKYSLLDTTAVQANTWTRLMMVRTTDANEKTFFDVVTQTAVSASGVTLSVKDINVIDLTQMFGSTIADYIYSLETANAGAGVAWFRKLFPKPYYAYNAGELMSVQAASHKTVGFNAWDEEWEVGQYSNSTGEKINATDRIRSKNFIPVVPSTTYYFRISTQFRAFWYDADKNFISYQDYNATVKTWTSPSNAHYLTFNTAGAYGTTYNHDICINLSWDGERDGEYEPYTLHEYPLDSSLTLRGIPKLDANNELYYDGDEYESDGTVTRKTRIIDFLNSSTFRSINVGQTSGGVWYADILKNVGDVGEADKPFINTAYTHIHTSVTGYSGAIKDYSSAFTIYDDAFENKNSTQAKEYLASKGVKIAFVVPTSAFTTESAEPYQNPQIVDDFGTEEYVDAGVTATTPTRDVAIPVGHVSQYQANLRAKLEMAPNSPDGDGDYIVRQTNGQNEYVALTFPADELPAAPTENGTYTLKCTVSGSGTTYAWVADT